MREEQMGFKSAIDDLSKSLRRMIFVNMLFLALVIPFALMALGVETSKVAFAAGLAGVMICTANFLLISNYYVRKTENTLTSSYESMENEYLYDELTKVYNRRAGLMRLNEEFARAKRNNSIFSIAMVDADHFKKINDKYGHIAGDNILTHIASNLRGGLRECDVVARYGGEEFLIILPDTGGKMASMPLDRVRGKLSNDAFDYNDTQIPVSISIGIATVSVSDADPMQVINRADKALYSAKRSGRNRVVYEQRQPQLRPALSHA
jgi:diguanylate cyclase (GGDEF)-like protein